MKISKNWLSNFISTPKSNDKLESDLTKLGLEVYSINKDKDDYIIDIEFYLIEVIVYQFMEQLETLVPIKVKKLINQLVLN